MPHREISSPPDADPTNTPLWIEPAPARADDERSLAARTRRATCETMKLLLRANAAPRPIRPGR